MRKQSNLARQVIRFKKNLYLNSLITGASCVLLATVLAIATYSLSSLVNYDDSLKLSSLSVSTSSVKVQNNLISADYLHSLSNAYWAKYNAQISSTSYTNQRNLRSSSKVDRSTSNKLISSSYFAALSKEYWNNYLDPIKVKPRIKNSVVKTALKPSGPLQTDSLFSPYPVWSQDFLSSNSAKLDSAYWNEYVGAPQNDNNEAEYYTNNRTNLRIQDGSLVLEATQGHEPQNYQYASSEVTTQNKKSFLYGRIDITATVPNGVGTWPAIWMLPANSKYANLSPDTDLTRYLNGGEIDIVEEVGSLPNVEYGIVHTLNSSIELDGLGYYNTVYVPNNDTTYNLYSVLWTPTSITFEVNNIPFFSYDNTAGSNYTTWPFNQPFYLVLNLALGGTWGGQDVSQYPPNGINNAILPASMKIQSIYYYPYTGS